MLLKFLFKIELGLMDNNKTASAETEIQITKKLALYRHKVCTRRAF